MGRMTDRKAKSIKVGDNPISHGGVGGLSLIPSTKVNGTGAWVLTYKDSTTGKRVRDTLGHYPEISIAQAAALALKRKALAASGKSPRYEERQRSEVERLRSGDTLRYVSDKFFEDGLKLGRWRSMQAVSANRARLDRYVIPVLGNAPIGTLTAYQITAALLTPVSPQMSGRRVVVPLTECQGIALDNIETTNKLLNSLSQIFTYAEYLGLRDNGNPIKAVREALRRRVVVAHNTKHWAAMPFENVPLFVSALLQTNPSAGRDALLTLILTAARSGAVRMMRLSDVSFSEDLWTLKAHSELSKTNNDVPYPLTPYLSSLLQGRCRKTNDTGYLFLNHKSNSRPISESTMPSILKSVIRRSGNVGLALSDKPESLPTVHGFRTAFRGWATCNGYADRLIERQLAHVLGNRVQQAYDREQMLDERYKMMTSWEAFVLGNSL